MPFSEYLKLIKSTDVSFDQLNTEDYQIVSAVTDMTKKTSIFFEFELKKSVNPRNENFAIIVEQLGNRLQALMVPDNNHVRFTPSAFNVMLVYTGKDVNKPKTQIIQALYGSKFKLTMIINESLKRGRYIILVSPVWHQSAFLELGYRQIRTAVYSSQKIQLKPFNRDEGFKIIGKGFLKINKGTASILRKPSILKK